MININNKTLSGIYKDGNEIVKILKGGQIVYQKEIVVNPYDSPGVYYHKITGECTINKARTNDKYDGIVVSDGTHVFRIGKERLLDRAVFGLWAVSTAAYNLPEYDVHDKQGALLDFDGYNTTQKLHLTYVDQVVDSSGNIGSPYAELAISKGGYVGAAGEWNLVWLNRETINDMLYRIGGDSISSGFYFSSTLVKGTTLSDDCTWTCVISASDSPFEVMSRGNGFYCRPFYKVER